MAHPGSLLNALTLPGLQPFKIKLPKHLGPPCSPHPHNDFYSCVDVTQIALTNHRLYLVDDLFSNDFRVEVTQVWAAPNPLPAKRHRK
jgi:hypothetical protein